MRFKLTLETVNNSSILPINYAYEFSAWIYKTIHYGDPKFSDWLHNHGYMDGKKQFRLFTFSRLRPEKYKIHGDRIELQAVKAVINISFYAEEAIGPFIVGLFRNQEFTIGDKISKVQFHVAAIEKLPEPEWLGTMAFRTDTPLVVSVKETENSKSATYLSPDDKRYGDYLLKNLTTKYLAVTKQQNQPNQQMTFDSIQPMQFKLLGTVKSKMVKIKSGTPEETLVRGYLFDFVITAPTDLIKLGYNAGFGEKNSLGFGCCEIVQQ
jgi:CRISPR-associated endoribonuclease Cas6